jgi:hypothetical protein
LIKNHHQKTTVPATRIVLPMAIQMPTVVDTVHQNQPINHQQLTLEQTMAMPKNVLPMLKPSQVINFLTKIPTMIETMSHHVFKEVRAFQVKIISVIQIKNKIDRIIKFRIYHQ